MSVVLSIKSGGNTLECKSPIVPVRLINDAAVVYLYQKQTCLQSMNSIFDRFSTHKI